MTPHSHTHGVCGGLVGDTSLTSPMPGIGPERAKNGVGGRLASDSGGVGCSENGVLGPSRLTCGDLALQFASYCKEVLDSCAHNEPGRAFILRRYRDKGALLRFP